MVVANTVALLLEAEVAVVVKLAKILQLEK
jgi:hypothetical protein